MRTKPPNLLPLFRSELQLRLLGLLLLEPGRWWTTAELRARLGAPAATVHRELHRALDAGLVVREGIGRTFRYRGTTDSPAYTPLRALLEATVGLEVELTNVLADVPGLCAMDAVLTAAGERVTSGTDSHRVRIGAVAHLIGAGFGD